MKTALALVVGALAAMVWMSLADKLARKEPWEYNRGYSDGLLAVIKTKGCTNILLDCFLFDVQKTISPPIATTGVAPR